MTTELERAFAFEERHRDLSADRIEPFQWGDVVLTPSLPQVWDLNLLRVTRPGASAEELAAEAERIQSEAGLGHRRVVALDRSLERGFRALGWEVSRFVFMAHRGAGERRPPPVEVAEVPRELLLPIREALAREAPWADDEEAVQQVLAAVGRVAEGAAPRHFAVVVDGRVASAADLYQEGETAQVEDVVTLPAHRNRGYASAVILRAVEEARAQDGDFVFLIADEEDWPAQLYARLGFEPIGRKWAFALRLSPGA